MMTPSPLTEPARPNTPAARWAWGCAAVFLATLAGTAPCLPEPVATHFNRLGQPDGWMSRTEHLLTFGTLSLVAGSCILLLGRFLHRFPARWLNVPRPTEWRHPAHYPAACHFLRGALAVLAGGCWLWFSALQLLLALANHSEPVRLVEPFTGALGGGILLGILLWTAWVWRFFSRGPATTPSP